MSSTQQLLLGEGAGGGGPVTYIEDVFSTYLYTGTGASNNIINGIEFSTKGGLVWLKNRGNTNNHFLFDTVRGGSSDLSSNTTGAVSGAAAISFLSNGFNCAQSGSNTNQAGANYVSWSFAKAPKFFDVVTYTGNGASSRAISHNLGSTPGCVIIKKTNGVANWLVWHRSLGFSSPIRLNLTNATSSSSDYWSAASSTTFTLGFDTDVNGSGDTYVMYLFAHDAGGFGLTGTDNVISCGSYTGTGSNMSVTLGYEPQYVMIKRTDSTGDWWIGDTMRGFNLSGVARLEANTSDAEAAIYDGVQPTSTGFFLPGGTALNGGGDTFIYIAIRRGPMKVPTSGTSVLGLNARGGSGANATVTGSAGVTDLAIVKNRGSATNWLWASRLTGTGYLSSNATTAETAAGTTILQANPWDVMDGVKVGTTSTITNQTSNTFINYLFDRAPSFFDEVCYTGTGAVRTINHNLGVAPELMIIKSRSNSGVNYAWPVYAAPRGATQGAYLNSTDEFAVGYGTPFWNDTAPTASVFTLGTTQQLNGSGATYVAYLFATCAGVSKVGSYTGNGTDGRVIDCGFTSGARFILLKKTNNTGDWAVWDTARGIISGNDPVLTLNSTAAEYGDGDQVDPSSSGFIVNNVGGFNTSGDTYIFLAIA